MVHESGSFPRPPKEAPDPAPKWDQVMHNGYIAAPEEPDDEE
jgi:hypothetical protein